LEERLSMTTMEERPLPDSSGHLRSIAGRVLLFSISGCPYCKRAKEYLRKTLRLPYCEVNLDMHPYRRHESYERSGRRTVPQIFFNAMHIGGCDDLLAIPSERIEELIATVLSVPPGSEAPLPPDEAAESSLSSLSVITAPDDTPPIECETDRYIDIIDKMRDPATGVVTKDRMYHLRKYSDCFVGRSAVDWFVQKGYAADRASAVLLGNILMERCFFHHVTHDHTFKDEKLFYRFLSDMKSNSLNSSDHSICEPEDPSKLAENIRRAILAIYDQHLSPDGLQVDYAGIATSAAFQRFVALTTQLQRVNLISMSREEKIAFFINIYNALVIHATVAQGPPKNAMQRSKFFNSVSYVIGGLQFTLNDIENGVLRANRRAPFGFFRPFSRSDPRSAIALAFHEPRIHFALVCGAKSCPPIKTYQASHIHEQLTLATQGFFEMRDNFDINESKRSISVSKILDWYSSDFGKSSLEIASWIASFLSPERRAVLQGIIDSGRITIDYRPYDWSTNSAVAAAALDAGTAAGSSNS
jgi:glutaredoxin